VAREVKAAEQQPSVSENDRVYFERLGAWERENHRRAFEEHMRLSMEDRLDRSWKMTRDLSPFVRRDADDDWPAQLDKRARTLGLC
jgi:hypothetical protein